MSGGRRREGIRGGNLKCSWVLFLSVSVWAFWLESGVFYIYMSYDGRGLTKSKALFLSILFIYAYSRCNFYRVL